MPRDNDDTYQEITVTIPQCVRLVELALKANRVPMVHGSPAIGKSAIVRQLAKEYGLFMIDLRLSQCDPTDLLGFPQIIEAINRAGYTPMETFPIAGDVPPAYLDEEGREVIEDDGKGGRRVKRYNGWLLFLDEFNSANRDVQAAAYKIVLDRMVGKYHLHAQVAVVCAGNLETDGAIVEQMSTALQSRLVHFVISSHADALSGPWVKWAAQNKIDHRIISFMEFLPKHIYSFKPDHTDRTYSSPRTWEFVNDFLKLIDPEHEDALPLFAGCIGQGVASEFLNFCKIFTNLPKISDIMAAPDQVRVSGEPSILYAMAGSIAHHTTASNMSALLTYVKRMPLEFQIVCVRMMLGRDNSLVNNADMQKWIELHAVDLF